MSRPFPYVFSALVLSLALSACSGSRQMTPQTGGIMLDTPQSVSPGSIAPAPMAKTAILPASVMAIKPLSAMQDASWTQIPGAASYAAAAPDGSLWVLSTAPAGSDKYIWHYVGGTWTNISGMATRLSVAPDGTLYAINSGGGAYSYSGGTWTGLGGGCSDITAASDGSIYVLSNGNSAGSDQAIWHNVSGTWSQAPGSGVRVAASWDPNSFTLGSATISANGLYVLNSIGGIYYKNPNDSWVQLPGAASAIAPTANGGVFVLGYPADSNGTSIYYFDLSASGWTRQSGAGVSLSTSSTHLYAIGSSGSIYSSTNGTITEYPIPTASSQPNGITTGPDGALWFTELNTNKIGRVTTSGAFTEYTIPTANSLLLGITTGPDGALWFAEQSKIGRVTTSGAFTEYPITAGSGPFGITTGADGALWFAEFNTGKIGRVSTSGAFTEYPIPTASSRPIGITTGPDGALWFTENSGNKIGKITP